MRLTQSTCVAVMLSLALGCGGARKTLPKVDAHIDPAIEGGAGGGGGTGGGSGVGGGGSSGQGGGGGGGGAGAGGADGGSADTPRTEAGVDAPRLEVGADVSPADVAPSVKMDAPCPAGRHLCSGTCVDNASVMTCGTACDPCPAVRDGTATCDGTQCGGTCPSGRTLCMGACLTPDQPCQGTCATGTHVCNGVCVGNNRPASCGTSCTACQTPLGGTATCDGTNCGFTCNSGKKCGDRCGACCTNNDCPGQSGKVATCDQTTLTCQYSCPVNNPKDCRGQCIASDACCSANGPGCGSGQVCRQGTCVDLKDNGDSCNTGGECKSQSCVGGHCCNSGEKFCDGVCHASGYCCNGTGCPITNGSGACSGGACVLVSCNSGFEASGNQCVPSCGPTDGKCPAGCGFQDFDCKKQNNQPCNANVECRDNNCARSTRCCAQGEDFIDGACRIPCSPEGAKRCAEPAGVPGSSPPQPVKNRVLEICMNGKFERLDCRDGGPLAFCGPVVEIDPNGELICGSPDLTCQSPLRNPSRCCDDVQCGAGSACVLVDLTHKECRTKKGERCDFGGQVCVPGTNCQPAGDGTSQCL
jgi:hypothetical protein